MTNKILKKNLNGVHARPTTLGRRADIPFNSAVRYMDTLPRGKFQWVSIRLLKKRSTEHVRVQLGQEVCDESKLLVFIRDSQGMILGKVSIKNQSKTGFGLEEEKMIREFAQVLGQQWSGKSA